MVIWLIGLSGAGKTTIGEDLYAKLKPEHKNLVFLDGDIFRNVMGDDIGHSIEDRRKNAGRICRMCKLLDDEGINVVCCILSLFPESRDWNREHLKNYFEVFIDVSMDELVRRDSKGLYAKALKGEIKDVAGVDIDFMPPSRPDLVLENEGDRSVAELVDIIKEKLPALS